MDRRVLLALKVTVIAVNLVIVTLLATSLYVVATGRLELLLPSGGDIHYRISGQDVLFESNVTIKNGGLYDITDVAINVQVWTQEGERLVDYRHPRFTIPAGGERVEAVSVPMNLSILQEANSLIFNDNDLTIAVDVEAFYTLGLIRFHSDYESTKRWGALVPWAWPFLEASTVVVYGDNVTVSIPYQVETSSLLSGEANVSVELRNESGLLSSVDVLIPLGVNHTGQADLLMTSETYQALRAETQVMDFAFVVELSGGARFEDVLPFPWRPP